MAVPRPIGVVIVLPLLTRALPGDPAAYCGPAAATEAVQQIRVKLGLDKPLYIQFVRFVGDLAHGDGSSLTTGQPVGRDQDPPAGSAELTLLADRVGADRGRSGPAATRPNSSSITPAV